jgi:hypothetical protein
VAGTAQRILLVSTKHLVGDSESAYKGIGTKITTLEYDMNSMIHSTDNY